MLVASAHDAADIDYVATPRAAADPRCCSMLQRDQQHLWAFNVIMSTLEHQEDPVLQ